MPMDGICSRRSSKETIQAEDHDHWGEPKLEESDKCCIESMAFD